MLKLSAVIVYVALVVYIGAKAVKGIASGAVRVRAEAAREARGGE